MKLHVVIFPGIFYFFKLHDFDKNGKLDGLELLHALTDHHSSASGHTEIGTSEQLFEEEVVSIIDNLLQKHDLNNDGYVDFVELMNSNPDSLWNELGTNLKVNGEASLDLAEPERLGGNQEGQQE